MGGLELLQARVTSVSRVNIENDDATDLTRCASNFPRPLRRRVAIEGPEVLDTLEGDAEREAPAELFPNTPAYWRRVDNAVRSHRAMMGPRPGA